MGAALVSFIISYFEDEKDEHAIPAWVEPAVIFTILVCNAFVGIYQDLNAEAALDKLKDLQSPHAEVLRDGSWGTIEAKFLVKGDIVRVRQGDKIPADIRLLTLASICLKTDQAILTGETNPVNKITAPLNKKGKIGVLDKINSLLAGTLVNGGTGVGIVYSTGMKTEIGIIQG